MDELTLGVESLIKTQLMSETVIGFEHRTVEILIAGRYELRNKRSIYTIRAIEFHPDCSAGIITVKTKSFGGPGAVVTSGDDDAQRVILTRTKAARPAVQTMSETQLRSLSQQLIATGIQSAGLNKQGLKTCGGRPTIESV